MSVKATFFFQVKTTTNILWNDAETLLKSFWISQLQMMASNPYSRIELVDEREYQEVEMKPTRGTELNDMNRVLVSQY